MILPRAAVKNQQTNIAQQQVPRHHGGVPFFMINEACVDMLFERRHYMLR